MNGDTVRSNAMQVYKHILLQSVDQQAMARFNACPLIQEALNEKGLYLRTYDDVFNFANGKDMNLLEQKMVSKAMNLVQEFISVEQVFSMVDVYVPYNIFSLECRAWLDGTKLEEPAIGELFHAVHAGEEISDYVFVGFTKMKQPPWGGGGKWEVAVWRNIRDPNALVE